MECDETLDTAFDVGFQDGTGAERRAPLKSACSTVRFEEVPPVRGFPSARGQRHFSGLYWSATSARHVGFESWLERDTAMLLDFDPRVVAFASQPFWLHWNDGRRMRRHAPDWFARLDDESGVVIDCRPPGRIGPRDQEAFDATERACAAVGWRFRLIGEVDRVQSLNLRWLAGYRHPRYQGSEAVRARLAEVFAQPRELLDGAGEIADPLGVLPVLYHLLWIGVLRCDLAVPLSERRLVQRAEGATW